jgi:hypothetical protein
VPALSPEFEKRKFLKGSWRQSLMDEAQLLHFLAVQLSKLLKLSFLICRMAIILLPHWVVWMVKICKLFTAEDEHSVIEL